MDNSLPVHFLIDRFTAAASGIGGLATALALQRRGLKCAVYERDALFQDRKQGYGLTLSNTPNGGLAKLGILEECIRQDCSSNSHWVFNPKVSKLTFHDI